MSDVIHVAEYAPPEYILPDDPPDTKPDLNILKGIKDESTQSKSSSSTSPGDLQADAIKEEPTAGPSGSAAAPGLERIKLDVSEAEVEEASRRDDELGLVETALGRTLRPVLRRCDEVLSRPDGVQVSAITAGQRRRLGSRTRGRPPSNRGRGRGRGGNVTRYKLRVEVAIKANKQPPTADVTSAAAATASLKTGDFLISVDDVNLDRPPIWRIDSKFLIQKYEPIKGKGQRLYKNMATYMSWSASTDKFRAVSVRYHQMGRSESIVELLDNPHSSTFNLSKMLSIKATSKYLENFEIYMQTLISQALDANFLLEITQEGDEYFMKNVAIVQETNLARKNKILELKSWDEKTQSELDMLPVLELVLLRNVPPSECAVCHQTANKRLVQLYGRPYDRNTLLTSETSAPVGKQQHYMCSFCAGLADLYNKVEHLTYHLYLRCCEKVALRRKGAPDDDSTRIVKDILADEAWLSKAFSDVQQVWGDVDQIYTAAKEEEQEEGTQTSSKADATTTEATTATTTTTTAASSSK